MRLKSFIKGLFIFGLVLFLGVFCSLGNVHTAYADETQEIKLNVNSQTLVKGKSFSLYVYNLSEGQEVAFVSSEPEVASVDEFGTVTGNMVGNATILVTVREGENVVAFLSCDIKVGPPAISVQFSRLELTLTVGEKATLERIVLPLNTVETAKFSSHDRTVATVSAGGRVTAKAEGSTYIFAQLDNGRFAVCKVYVQSEAAEEAEEISAEQITVVLPEHVNEITVELPTGDGPVAVAPTETLEEVPEDTAEQEISDPFLLNTEEMDFETFLKNLNAADKSAEDAESATGDAN